MIHNVVYHGVEQSLSEVRFSSRILIIRSPCLSTNALLQYFYQISCAICLF